MSTRIGAYPNEVAQINEVAQRCYDIGAEHGFHEDDLGVPDTHLYKMNSRVALIMREASEALEELRETEVNSAKVAEELADTVIRTFDMAVTLGLDIGQAIADKMAYNASRPYKHGKVF